MGAKSKAIQGTLRALKEAMAAVEAGEKVTKAQQAMVAAKKADDAAKALMKEATKVQKKAIPEAQRIAFPGIYQRPDVIAAEAASRVAPESPAMKRLFGVDREDLYQIGKGRKGNLPGTLPGLAANFRGAEAAEKIITPRNTQRILDVMSEAENHPELVRGMDPWYVMDPMYQRMVQLLGKDRAMVEYAIMNNLSGMASPGSEVMTEIPRGSAAYYLHKQGRFPEFVEHLGKPEYLRGDVPADIVNVPGHMYHKTAQAIPMKRYLDSGQLDMTSPKVPMYIEASGVPDTGFQTATPVGDAHWSRAVGLADTRGGRTIKGTPAIPGASVSNSEMGTLAPWWRNDVAGQLGLESVPAQARAWGAFSGQTGVTTPIGSPKLELISDQIMETARRLGISPESARDLVLTGEARMGKKKGGIAHMAEGGQEFPLQKPAYVTNADMTPTEVHPFAGALSRGLSSVHNFVSKPFGYENPPAEMVSDFIGIPSIAKTLENYAYGTPNTSGSGQATRLNEDAVDAAMSLPFGSAQAAYKLTKRAVPAIKKAAIYLAPTVADMMEADLRKYGMINDIIKPKGGNWMPDSPEQMTRNLKKSTIHTTTGQSPSEALADIEKVWPKETSDAADLSFRQEVEDAFPTLKRDAAIEKWVDQKLNKYIKNEMGTESDPIRLGIERRYTEAQELRKANQKRLDKMANDIEAARAEGKSTALSERRLELAKEQFAEEEDIAFQGLYHGTIPEGGWQNFESWYEDPIKEKRARVGMPTEGLGTHPASKYWESIVDDEIGSYLGSDLKAPHLKNTLLIKENPWLANLADDARINKIDSMDTNLEFRHMIDELKASLDPTSNLPKHLKITPKDLEKMTVDDVSALSGKINGWRSVQKTKTNLEVANNPATHTFKEYPLDESNPKGVSWKQIKKPEGLPEEEAEKAVRDAINYEGDIMRHCVGGAGHCEPLLRGDVELYTLRDAKGEPHVTIEVQRTKHPYDLTLINNDTKYKYQQYIREWRQRNPTVEELTNQDVYAALREAGVPPKPPRILEIKGKNNRKPKPEYIPFVQDFIKSGNFSIVGDMHHADLLKLLPDSEVAIRLRKAGSKNIPKYLTNEEVNNLSRWLDNGGDLPEGFADGGAVHMADGGEVHWIDHLKNQLAGGGQPEANDSDWIDHLRSQVSAEVKKEMGSDNDKYRSEALRLPESAFRGFSPRFQGFGFPTSVDIHRPYPIVEGAHVRGMVDVPIDRAQFSLGASSNVINTPEALLFTPPSRHMEARMPVGKGNLMFLGMKNPKSGQKDLRLMYEQQFAAGGLAK